MRHILLAVCAVLAATSAQAGTPFPVEKKCPIGGERFTHIETGSYSTWGARPDGKPYGSWTFPWPLPECPRNGLVLYKDFSKEELAKLKPLIASAEYRAMAKRDTPYYRAAWLVRALEPESQAPAALLLRASWEADYSPELRARYQREFIDAMAKLPPAPNNFQRFMARAHVVNAYRELGQFDESLAQLRALATEVDALVIPNEEDKNNQDAHDKRTMLAYLANLEKIILRKDASTEPLEMLPVRIVAEKCMDMPDTSRAVPAGICESPVVVARIKLLREWRGETEAGDSQP